MHAYLLRIIPTPVLSSGSYTHVLHWLCRKLYWVDSEHKTLESVDVGDESNRITVSSLGDVTGSGHVYGLALDDAGSTAYVSCWMGNASIIQVNLSDGTASVYKSGLSAGPVFSNVYVSSGQQSGSISSIYFPLFLSVCLSICPSIHPSIYLSPVDDKITGVFMSRLLN